MVMMKSTISLALATLGIGTQFATVAGFGIGSSPLIAVRCPSASSTGGSTVLQMSSPGGTGDWDNEDFLESLSGGGGGAGGENPANEGGNVERIVPENDMTDEEVTMMAMRNAQFRNSDVAIEEVYGKPREEEDGEGEFQ